MRVLLITGSFPPMTCGVGDYTAGLAQALAARPDVEVAILTSTGARSGSPPEGCSVYPVIANWTLSDLPRINQVLRTWRPDLVHVQYPTQGYRNYLSWQLPGLVRLRGIPVVQTWHEYVPSDFRVAFPQVVMGLVPGDLIVVRPDYRDRMPGWFRALGRRKRLHVILNAPTVPRVTLSTKEREAVRERLAPAGKTLLAFFGFMFQNKGIDDLLKAMDPARHQLVLVGDVKEDDPYQADLVRRCLAPPFAGSVSFSGFLSPPDAARIMAAADAVVLPFREGGGNWNTSIKAAALQGTFVLTTSTERHGFDPAGNIYFAHPRDPADLRRALALHCGSRTANPSPEVVGPSWAEIAERHVEVYSEQ